MEYGKNKFVILWVMMLVMQVSISRDSLDARTKDMPVQPNQ